MRYAPVLLILVLVPHVAWGQVVDKCQAAKIKAAGKKTLDKAKCHAKALQKGVAVDPLCLTKAEDKFAKAITKADTLGPCSGTATDLEAAVDQCVDTYAAVVSTPVTTTTVMGTSTTTSTTLPFCGLPLYPSCGGMCSAGESCYAVRDIYTGYTDCLCQPTGTPCCGGAACSPGQICTSAVDVGICFGCQS
jgi:hypothetical protein